jgi:hypothetical protein
MNSGISQYEEAGLRILFWNFRSWAMAYVGAMTPDSLARYAGTHGIDAETVLRAIAQVKAERGTKQHKVENDECRRRADELIAREKSEGKVYGGINASIGPFAGQITAVATHTDPETGDLAEIAKDAPNHDAPSWPFPNVTNRQHQIKKLVEYLWDGGKMPARPVPEALKHMGYSIETLQRTRTRAAELVAATHEIELAPKTSRTIRLIALAGDKS